MEDDGTSVRVALRIRPLNSKEMLERSKECIKRVPSEPAVVLGNNQVFTYDHVFEAKSPQNEVFDMCVKDLVGSFFTGFNTTVLAYGQTGSGKTYTMGSNPSSGYVDNSELGVIPRVIDEIYSMVEKKKSTHNIDLKVSFLELYNEDIRDMLSPDSQNGASLPIRENTNGEVYIPGLIEEKVNSGQEMLQALVRGSLCRTTGSTLMNLNSSRSHAIFNLVQHVIENYFS